MGYARSLFPDFEFYLRIVADLDEDDIPLILKQYKSYFITYEIPPDIYTIKEVSEIVYTKGNLEGTLQIEYDDNSMETKLILTQFSGNFGS